MNFFFQNKNFDPLSVFLPIDTQFLEIFRQNLPDDDIGVNLSVSSCVGDTLLLLLVLCGDDNVDTALLCESIARIDVIVVPWPRVVPPQKFKSNLLPVKRTSRSRSQRRASRSLSKCNCKM